MSMTQQATFFAGSRMPPMSWLGAAMPACGRPSEVATQPAHHYTANAEIYGAGTSARWFYVLISGVVRTCRFLSDGTRQIEAFYVAGEIFGLEEIGEHRLTAEAVCDCAVIALRRDGIERGQKAELGLANRMLDYAMRHLGQAREHAMLLGRRGALQRLAAFLLETAARQDDADVIALSMPRQDIVDYLGMTIETVSRSFSQLERDGLIGLPAARRIAIKDREALEDLVA
jgi:CRP/FNR family nitrogen fixation transcriptional regulator